MQAGADQLVAGLAGVEAQQLGQAVAVGRVLDDAQLDGLAELAVELGVLALLGRLVVTLFRSLLVRSLGAYPPTWQL